MTQTPQHWPTERMITEGHADYATPEDLDGLDNSLLIDIARLCDVETLEPDECIPCRAYTIIADREKTKEEGTQTAPSNTITYNPESPEDQARLQAEIDAVEAGREMPRLSSLMGEPSRFQTEEKPVVERFADAVEGLQELVTELLEGPPIPPPNVTLEELGALVVGAKKWLSTLNAQGLELSPGQESVRQEIQRVVEKVQRG